MANEKKELQQKKNRKSAMIGEGGSGGKQGEERNSMRRQLQRLSSNLSANESNFMLIVAILSQKKNAIMCID